MKLKKSKKKGLNTCGIKVAVYHGTPERNIPTIKKKGIKNPFVTTSVYTAKYYGDFHCHYNKKEESAILKLKVPLCKLYWAHIDGEILERAGIDDLEDEENLRERDDTNDSFYLYADTKIPPKDIEILPRSKKIRKIEKEKSTWDFKL